MSIHKLSAGSGYDYLTRQVATLDATEKGHVGLASYYTERGETPGAWIGSGLAGIDGLTAGDTLRHAPTRRNKAGAAGRRRLVRHKHQGSDSAWRTV
jgi:TrwC relaxase